ncbi:hypothetical protein AGOR_G00165550 [Albula goreensis]|uniref:CRIB domain-containing protein n=1 Tax=Albula goreensis TaxID=1534307 RepID=A0A8T3D156_9TELE|nr:hypothetical protein AGOR_G00165550 [Albula goreensis]
MKAEEEEQIFTERNFREVQVDRRLLPSGATAINCCIAEQPQPKRRRQIDRSMIGEPTNFVHTTHVGSRDMEFSGVDSIQAQMKSKGGYGPGASDGGQE